MLIVVDSADVLPKVILIGNISGPLIFLIMNMFNSCTPSSHQAVDASPLKLFSSTVGCAITMFAAGWLDVNFML